MAKNTCFATLAVGDRYRAHARLLAEDIQQHAPGMAFVVLTDRPEDFAPYAHVIALKHQIQSVKGYHDKRFVLEAGLTRFETCIFLDSDVRILGAIRPDLELLPGITARISYSLVKRASEDVSPKVWGLITNTAEKLDIHVEEVQWLHEFMFAIKRQNGAEMEFLRYWQTLSYVFELAGIYQPESLVMGLAAAKAGLPIRPDYQDWFPFFKDKIEQVRLQKGQSTWEEKQIYFQSQREIEFPPRSLWQKAISKLMGKVIFFYRLLRLRIQAQQDPSVQRLVA
jgi:hypothetical protein